MTGVYKITNPEGKIYIGASIDVKSRIKQYSLPSASKDGRTISESIKNHGYENHLFEIIEQCNPDELYKRESFWIDKLGTLSPNGLNSSKGNPYSDRYRNQKSSHDVGKSIKGFRLPIALIKRLESAAKKDNRNVTNFLINHLEETLPKEK